jgi:hypothetical protein
MIDQLLLIFPQDKNESDCLQSKYPRQSDFFVIRKENKKLPL